MAAPASNFIPELPDLLPPHSLEAEQAALSSALQAPEAVDTLLALCAEGDFYHAGHRKLYAAIARLAGKDEGADLFTVPEELHRTGDLEAVGGREYVGELVQLFPTTAHQEHYCRIIAEKAGLRKLLQASEQVKARVYGGEPLADVARFAAQAADAASISRGIGEPVPSRLVAVRVLEDLFSGEERRRGLPTGLVGLQALTGGWQDGQLVFIAGRPGMGKSAAMLHFARKAEVPCLIFSLEMGQEELLHRNIAALARVDSRAVVRPLLLDLERRGRVQRAIGDAGDLPIDIEDRADLSMVELRAIARRWRRQHPGPCLILLDYLQLLQWPAHAQNENNAIEHNANQCKALAKELGCPFLVLSQLRRIPQDRKNKRPQLQELRGSGGIEQAGDLVILLHRESYYQQEQEQDKRGMPVSEATWPQVCELIIAKHRQGATGTVWANYDGPTSRFGELDELTDADAPPARVRDRWRDEG